jgi:hypothetical protein
MLCHAARGSSAHITHAEQHDVFSSLNDISFNASRMHSNLVLLQSSAQTNSCLIRSSTKFMHRALHPHDGAVSACFVSELLPETDVTVKARVLALNSVLN